jgi:hypothetical protein
MFFIILILTAAVVLSLHGYLMRAVESHEGYGGGSFREWKDFEKQKLGF